MNFLVFYYLIIVLNFLEDRIFNVPCLLIDTDYKEIFAILKNILVTTDH